MKCPVCQYPNPPGSPYCGLCHEVLSRSAARTYLEATHRARRHAEPKADPALATADMKDSMAQVVSVIKEIDWKPRVQKACEFVFRHKKIFLYGLAACLTWGLIRYLFSPSFRVTVFGHRLMMEVPRNRSLQYLVGLQTEIKMWSEFQGRLDTPMANSKSNEMGRVEIERAPQVAKTPIPLKVRVLEWIQVFSDGQSTQSHSIAPNHPTIAPGKVLLDREGRVLERRVGITPRLGKSISFLFPRFPKGALRSDTNWEEPVEWVETLGEWKIHWFGKLQWTLHDPAPCHQETCSRLTYQAHLSPSLSEVPDWAKGAVRHATLEGLSTQGEADFDGRHRRLVSNVFAYEGTLRMPITNLARIPWGMRVGHRVRGAGELLLFFKNKIDLRLN
jgi:hypothetical protein